MKVSISFLKLSANIAAGGETFKIEEPRKQLQETPLSSRGLIRRKASAIALSKSKLQKNMETTVASVLWSKLKLVLIVQNRRDRLKSAIENFSINICGQTYVTILNTKSTFMRNDLIFSKEVRENFFCEGEEEPHRAVVHNSLLKKVMLLVTVARLQWDTSGNGFTWRQNRLLVSSRASESPTIKP